jgi:hypothetical protein
VPYPILLKPYPSHSARAVVGGKVIVAETPARLVQAYADCAAAGVPMFVQEIVPGADSNLFGYLRLVGRDGDELAWLTKRKLRQERHPTFRSGVTYVNDSTCMRISPTGARALSAFATGCAVCCAPTPGRSARGTTHAPPGRALEACRAPGRAPLM